MDNEHRFDALNKALIGDTSRRALLRAVAAVIFAGNSPLAKAAKSRKKGKGDRKRKKKPNPAPSCSRGACAAEPEWVGDDGEIGHCEFVCQQCDGDDPRQFCIVQGRKPDGSQTSVARCCDEGQECCGLSCCDQQSTCCRKTSGSTRVAICIAARVECCEDDSAGYCDPETPQVCCPGVGCVQCPDVAAPRDLRCCGSTCYNAVYAQCCYPDHPCPRTDVFPEWACCPPPLGCCIRGSRGCCE